jgi:hypothetical protein
VPRNDERARQKENKYNKYKVKLNVQ